MGKMWVRGHGLQNPKTASLSSGAAPRFQLEAHVHTTEPNAKGHSLAPNLTALPRPLIRSWRRRGGVGDIK